MSAQKYQCLFFDFDNTLVDFTGAAKAALWQSFSDYGYSCNDKIYQIYRQLNHRAWVAFEQGQITAERLRVQRFEDLFAALNYSPTTPSDFSQYFLQQLVLKSTVYTGVSELLQQLRPHYTLGIITNGLKEVQRPRLARLQLTELFDVVVVSDEIGVAKPDTAFFDYAYQQLPTAIPKNEILVIGDNQQSDILGANNYGLDSCWISHDRTLASAPAPTYTIPTVHHLPKLL